MSTLKKLKAALVKCEEAHLHALDALAGSADEDEDNPAPDATTALETARARLDEAFALLKKMPSAADDDQELSALSWSKTKRSTTLGRLDRANVGVTGIIRKPFGKIFPVVSAPRSPPPPPAVRELGGAHLAAQVREDERRRLKAFWQ